MTVIIIKNSAIPGKVPVPSDLNVAELGLQLADQKLYSKDHDDNIFEIGKAGEVPTGGTPDRPSSGNELGDLFFDTDLDILLYWNGTDWVPVGQEAIALDDLTDVNANSPGDGELLAYNSATGLWEAVDPGTLAVDVDLDYTPNGDLAGTVTNTAGDDATIPIATNTVAGLFTGAEKVKLDGIEAGATVPNDGTLTISDAAGNSLGTFTADQAGDSNIQLPASASVNDGVMTILQGGAYKGDFSANQANNTQIQLDAGFSGDYNDLSNTPTIGDGTITLTQGGVQKGTFTVNQSGPTTIDFDAGGSGGGITGADAPLEVSGDDVKLNYSKGLHVVADKLEAYLGDGLEFDGDKIKVIHKADEVAFLDPVVGSTSGGDDVKFGGAGKDSPSQKRTVSVNVPAEATGFISIVMWKYWMLPNPDVNYANPDNLSVQRIVGNFFANVSNRSANCISSGSGNSVALVLGSTIAWSGGGGPGGGNAFQHFGYGTRTDEWTCDASSGNINFEFGCKDVEHNKVKLGFNEGCRVLILPYIR